MKSDLNTLLKDYGNTRLKNVFREPTEEEFDLLLALSSCKVDLSAYTIHQPFIAAVAYLDVCLQHIDDSQPLKAYNVATVVINRLTSDVSRRQASAIRAVIMEIGKVGFRAIYNGILREMKDRGEDISRYTHFDLLMMSDLFYAEDTSVIPFFTKLKNEFDSIYESHLAPMPIKDVIAWGEDLHQILSPYMLENYNLNSF